MNKSEHWHGRARGTQREWRLASAVFLGVIFDAVFFWKFQPYATREHGHDLLPWYFLPILAFLAGLLLTVAQEGQKRRVPIAIFGEFCAANAFLIVAGCMDDPTNHNRWPFEFVLIALATAPAFLAAGLISIIDHARQSQSRSG